MSRQMLILLGIHAGNLLHFLPIITHPQLDPTYIMIATVLIMSVMSTTMNKSTP